MTEQTEHCRCWLEDETLVFAFVEPTAAYRICPVCGKHFFRLSTDKYNLHHYEQRPLSEHAGFDVYMHCRPDNPNLPPELFGREPISGDDDLFDSEGEILFEN
jgi:hypothetical protein